MSDETKCPDCGEAWGHKYECVVMRIRREGVNPPTPDPRERGEDEQHAAYTFVPSDPELALALDSAAKMAREADEKFCAAFGGDGETSAFWLTAAVSEIRAALSRQALRAPARGVTEEQAADVLFWMASAARNGKPLAPILTAALTPDAP